MKVRVLKIGFWHDRRVWPGQEMDIPPESFSARWMEALEPMPEPVKAQAPEVLTHAVPTAKGKTKKKTKTEVILPEVEEVM